MSTKSDGALATVLNSLGIFSVISSGGMDLGGSSDTMTNASNCVDEDSVALKWQQPFCVDTFQCHSPTGPKNR